MCGSCEGCVFVDAPTDKLFYEIHITMEPNDKVPDSFFTDYDIKVITIANFNGNNQFNNYDFMTVYKVPVGEDPFKHLALLEKLISREFKILRSKIETVPWHPLCNLPTDPTGYFEAHLKVAGDLDIRIFSDIGLKKSLRAGGGDFTMLTYRENVSRQKFNIFLDQILKYLTDFHNIKLAEKPIIEYALYDTNLEHDKGWFL